MSHFIGNGIFSLSLGLAAADADHQAVVDG